MNNPDYPPERTMPGAIARLLSEDWHEMTRAALASPNHVSSPEHWERKAREANPALDAEQAARLGRMLKRQHFQRMGRLSAQARAAGRRPGPRSLDEETSDEADNLSRVG